MENSLEQSDDIIEIILIFHKGDVDLLEYLIPER